MSKPEQRTGQTKNTEEKNPKKKCEKHMQKQIHTYLYTQESNTKQKS